MGAGVLLGTLEAGRAQTQLRSLANVPIQEPANLGEYVEDRKSLIALGKVLFWDMQAGSDGFTACATCHFHAGADHRPQNQISDPNRSFAVNRELPQVQFPLRLLSDPANRNSAPLRDSSMRIGSAGTVRRIFDGIILGQAAELGHDEMDKPEFLRDGLSVRRVTERNTPSVFNTVYYARGFWDGRAARNFNGFSPTGGDDVPGVLVTVDGALESRRVSLDPASLASQATGPVLDHLEMSYAGRTWPLLAKKLLSLPPLGLQRVSVTDSVLGDLARTGKAGLVDEVSYLSMIRKAFRREFWESSQLVDAAGSPLNGRTGSPKSLDEFTQVEYNFPLFWGLALQAYQSTLNSDDSPFDRFMAGDGDALTALQQEGLRFFQGAANCNECHNGAEFSAAAMNPNRGNRAHAFDRTGVRPAAEDAGTGNGSFKSISLRNVEFTGPYFHNGGQATLEQVVDFYRRGGDFSPVANDLRPFAMSSAQRASLVAFLKALSDDRVRYERAPFDHPELCVPVGHLESDGVLIRGDSARFPASAAEKYRLVPATGAGGNLVPLRTFEEMLTGTAGLGERAHSLTEPCPGPADPVQ
jgi:cytochrome c peroxidase